MLLYNILLSINNIYLYKILKNSVDLNLYIKFPNKSAKITV